MEPQPGVGIVAGKTLLAAIKNIQTGETNGIYCPYTVFKQRLRQQSTSTSIRRLMQNLLLYYLDLVGAIGISEAYLRSCLAGYKIIYADHPLRISCDFEPQNPSHQEPEQPSVAIRREI